MEFKQVITDTNEVVLQESGTYLFQITDHAQIHIQVKPNITVNLLVEIDQKEDLQVSITVEQDATCRAFLMHNTQGYIEETHTLKENASLYIATAELSRGTMSHKATYNLEKSGATLEARYAYVSDEEDRKELHVYADHQSPNTSSNLELYGVMKKNAKLKAEVSSHIVNGAHQAAAHQTSRILNFDGNVSAEVSPILLIDEDEVSASHACSMGAVDENHLYYLQSRGLSADAAIALIVNGYLAVLAETFTEAELQEIILEEIHKKAGV